MKSWAMTSTGCRADGDRHFRTARHLSGRTRAQTLSRSILQAETRMISAANVLERYRTGSQAWRICGTGIRSFCRPHEYSQIVPVTRTEPRLHVLPGANMERAAIRPPSTSEIVLLMPWRNSRANPCWQREPISLLPTSRSARSNSDRFAKPLTTKGTRGTRREPLKP